MQSASASPHQSKGTRNGCSATRDPLLTYGRARSSDPRRNQRWRLEPVPSAGSERGAPGAACRCCGARAPRGPAPEPRPPCRQVIRPQVYEVRRDARRQRFTFPGCASEAPWNRSVGTPRGHAPPQSREDGSSQPSEMGGGPWSRFALALRDIADAFDRDGRRAKVLNAVEKLTEAPNLHVWRHAHALSPRRAPSCIRL